MPPVLHGLSLDPNQRLSNALLTRDEARRIAANVACQSRGVRHDTATRQRIWPSCRSSHCHSRLSVFVSPTTVSLEASTSGRLYRRAFKAVDWSDIANKKILFKRGSSAAHAWSRRSNFPDFGHESEYALFGLAGKPLKLGEWRAIIRSCPLAASRRPGPSKNGSLVSS